MKRRINTRGRFDLILRRHANNCKKLRMIEEAERAVDSFMRSDDFLRTVIPDVHDPVITKVSDDVVHIEIMVPGDRVEVSCQLEHQ